MSKNAHLAVLKPISYALLAAFVAVFAVNSFLATGGDFPVFWSAGRNLIHGSPIYDYARDGAQCFKYPPWIAPLFIPISLLSLRGAEAVWRLLVLSSSLYSLGWVIRRTQSAPIAILVFVSFWGVWMFNLVQGQVTSVLLALALFGFSLAERKAVSGAFLVAYSLSAKIFNVVSILGMRKFFSPRPLLATIGIFCVLSAPALLGYEGLSPARLFEAYAKTAGSSGGHLSGANYGLPILWIQLLGLSKEVMLDRVIGFAISMALLVALVIGFRKRLAKSELSEWERLALGLALGASIHPLLFSYGFVWVYPLAAFTMDRAFAGSGDRRKSWIASTILLILGVTQSDRWGALLGEAPLRAISVWGLAGVFILTTGFSSGERIGSRANLGA